MKNSAHYKALAKYLNGECTPEEKRAIEEWYAALDSMRDDDRLLDDQEEDALQQKMLTEIHERIAARDKVSASPRRVWFLQPMRVAAAVLLLAVAGSALVLFTRQGTHLPFIYNGDASEQIVTLRNVTTAVEEHRLPDGSLIKLKPGGTIIYAKEFAANQRQVRLVGEAFFDVTKDKTRPFIINAHDVMVKVLGTSFNVVAYENDPEVKVAVKTGKVSVTRPVNNTNHTGLDEVILTPNQQVVYNMVKENFSKQIVASPQIILAKPTLFHMEYDATPVDELFKVLEENYGIDIVFDPAVLSSCTLTTTMEEEGFYERIEIICRAIGATFEIQDARVLIKSTGCQELNN